jgi:hypothetical protein
MAYEVLYSRLGIPASIRKDGTKVIPLNENNSSFRDFLIWNAEQVTPLDWQSSITPAPPTAADSRKAAAYAKAISNTITLKGMTPDQGVAWVEANITGTPNTKLLLKELVWLALTHSDEIWPLFKDA